MASRQSSPPSPPDSPWTLVQRQAQALGFALAGVAPAAPVQRRQYVHNWLTAGQHGEMAYLERNLEVRLDPGQLLAGARSVICVADVYPAATTAAPDEAQRPRGRIARYAWGDDYHRIIKKRLFQLADALRRQWPEHQFRAAVDTAPIMERDHATRAGLGWIGKHTLLVNRHFGSWLLLGQLVTTLDFTAAPRPPAASSDHCGTCRCCIDACPTGCISADGYQLDASRCISYLTIEHRGAIDPALHAPLGDWIAGCDVCQEVCPFNRPKKNAGDVAGPTAGAAAHHAGYAARPPAPAIGLLEVLAWNAGARQDALRRSALKRIRLDMFKRNALIAAGNYLGAHADRRLSQRVRTIAADRQETAMVRLTARQVLAARSRGTCD